MSGGRGVDGGRRARGTGTILAEPAWRPDPRARLLWGTELVLSWLLPIIGFAVWVFLDDGRRGWQAVVGTVLAIAVVATVAVIPVWRYAVHRWEITEEAVYTRVGWLTQESRVAPISRVQTVEIERGPLDRTFGLATVTVTTASSAGAVPITGLDLPVAEDAVARLTQIAALHRGDAT
ncbi:PH domain-containing protein [Nocardia sp. NPDC050697]|uniref:PH domain-containing protein n=1 Tax=Nocardia sp. NPDC050697 TaxID=3155158 RepID=UPI0033EF1551